MVIKPLDNLRKSLFWDVNPDKLNLEKSAPFIIGRVLDYGNLKEWKLIKKIYGESRIISVVKEHIFSDPRSANFWALFFSISADQLKCSRKPSLKIPNAFWSRFISPKVLYKSNIYLAGLPDIAVMKLEAVGRRGTYKDFLDLYFLLQEYKLGQLLVFLREKFAGIEYNETHLLKSITYFEDAKKSEFPEMIKKVEWEEVKRTLVSAAKQYMK